MPAYDTLSTEKMLQYLNDFPEYWQYVPTEGKELRKLPKQWLVNVAWTIVQDPLGEWVKAQIEERNYKMAVEKNLMINMDPEVAQAFAHSSAVSRK